MMEKIKEFVKSQMKTDIPDIRPGDTVKVYQKIKDPTQKDSKERIQFFEGQVISRKHGGEIGATITVRRTEEKVDVEKIFPLHSPTIEKIELLKRGKVRRAKIYYLRKKKGKKAKLKTKEVFDNRTETKEKPKEEEEIDTEKTEEKKEKTPSQEKPEEKESKEPIEEENTEGEAPKKEEQEKKA